MSYEQCCQVLGVDTNTNIDGIKTAFRLKAREWHPDMYSTESQETIDNVSKIMQGINEAYTTLSENYYENSANTVYTNEKNTASTPQNENSFTDNTNKTKYGYDFFAKQRENEQRSKEKEEKYKDLFNKFDSRFSKYENSFINEEQKQRAAWRNQNIYANMTSKIYESNIFEILLVYMSSKYKDLDIKAMITLYILNLNEMQNVEENTQSFGRAA